MRSEMAGQKKLREQEMKIKKTKNALQEKRF